MKDFLLFTSDWDGEYYQGAFSTLEEAKASAFEDWDGYRCTSYIVRKTSDDGFSLCGETASSRGGPYLKWSDETLKDIGYQKEKRAKIKARRKREEEMRKIERSLLEKKEAEGALTFVDRMNLGFARSHEATVASMIDTIVAAPRNRGEKE